MPPEIIDASSFSSDIQEFLRLLSAHEVRAVVVGGEAVIFYGHIRVTGDIDIFYDRSPKNAARLFGIEKNVATGFVSISFFKETFDDPYNIIDMVCSLGFDSCPLNL